MSLHEAYQNIDQGKLENLFELIQALEGNERLEGELWKAFFMLEVYGELEQAFAIVEDIFSQCQNNIPLQSFARIQRGFILLWGGKYKGSENELEKAKELLSTLSEENTPNVRLYQAHLWLVKGLCSFSQGNFDQAVDNFSQGLQITTDEKFPLKSLTPIIQDNMGFAYQMKGDLDRAVTYHEKSLTILTELGNDIMKSTPLSHLGGNFLWRGDVAQTQEYSQKALELAQKGGYKLAKVFAMITLGRNSKNLGNLEQAKQYQEQALEIAEDMKNPLWIVGTLFDLGMVYNALKDLKRAEECFQQVLAILKEINPTSIWIGEAILFLGPIYWAQGDLNKAEEYFQQSLEFLGDDWRSLYSLGALGNLHFTRGEIDKAEMIYQRAMTLYERIGWQKEFLGDGVIEYNMMSIYWARGELSRAEEACRKGLAVSEEKKTMRGLANGKTYLVQILLAQERLEEAAAEVDQLDEIAQVKKLPYLEVSHQLVRGQLYLMQFNLELALKAATEAKTQAAANNEFDLLVKAMKLLIQGQLQLYMNSKKDQHKTQLEEELQELNHLSKREYLHSAYIETLLIKGMLLRVEFDLPKAIQQFEEAETLATEQGLQMLAQKAQTEIHQLNTQSELLRRMMEQTPDAYKNKQMGAVIDYLKEAQKMVEIEAHLQTAG